MVPHLTPNLHVNDMVSHMENAKAFMNFTIKDLQTYKSMNKIGAYINNILNKFFTILFVLRLNN